MRVKPLHERDQASVAIVGTIVLILVVLLSMNLGRLPFLHPQSTYSADFATAAGIKSGDDVRVAGITVGSVSSVKVRGDHVHVRFTVKRGLQLGDQTRASIEIATVLGQQFLQLRSAGSGQLRARDTIPVDRTTVPYTLLDALGQFGRNTAKTDLPQLRTALDSLAATLDGTAPKDVQATLAGLSKLSSTVAARQGELVQLLDSARSVTNTLNAHSGDFVALLTDSSAFLQMLQQRRDVIAALLKDTSDLGAQVSALIRRDGANLTALLDNLRGITAVLARDKQQLSQAVTTLGEFSKNVANATGSGPWLDLFTPLLFEPDNVIKACGAAPKPKCGQS
jgi:phospholipid/cholesterol/gamma-HCH transport system substrate-binding protein